RQIHRQREPGDKSPGRDADDDGEPVAGDPDRTGRAEAERETHRGHRDRDRDRVVQVGQGRAHRGRHRADDPAGGRGQMAVPGQRRHRGPAQVQSGERAPHREHQPHGRRPAETEHGTDDDREYTEHERGHRSRLGRTGPRAPSLQVYPATPSMSPSTHSASSSEASASSTASSAHPLSPSGSGMVWRSSHSPSTSSMRNMCGPRASGPMSTSPYSSKNGSISAAQSSADRPSSKSASCAHRRSAASDSRRNIALRSITFSARGLSVIDRSSSRANACSRISAGSKSGSVSCSHSSSSEESTRRISEPSHSITSSSSSVEASTGTVWR